jgi:uncharacterized protein YozE (UPF0346 family)
LKKPSIFSTLFKRRPRKPLVIILNWDNSVTNNYFKNANRSANPMTKSILTAAAANIFEDLGFPPQEAEHLEVSDYLKSQGDRSKRVETQETA